MRAFQRLAFGLSGPILALVPGLACSGGDPGTTEKLNASVQYDPNGASFTTQLFHHSQTALTDVRHGGVRRIEAHYEIDGAPVHLVYREDIVTDGMGGFALEVGDILANNAGGNLFGALYEIRKGYYFRYRDFAIRDTGLFQENYSSQVMPQGTLVAGRNCADLLVSPTDGVVRFRAAIDVQTGLVLRFEEFDADGVTTALMEYETFDANPDLSNVDFVSSSRSEVTLDLGQELGPQLGFEYLRPHLVPQGYRLTKASLLTDGEGTRRLMLSYTDGIENLFFIHTAPEDAATSPEGWTPADARQKDKLALYRIGTVSVLQGTVAGWEVIVVGKASQDELADLIESALP